MGTLSRLPKRIMVAVDFAPDDDPEPCEWCEKAWHYEQTNSADGPVLREWHQQGCAVVTDWEESPEDAQTDDTG